MKRSTSSRFVRSSRAFTLIEMLVVIGIIVVLAGLLLPAIAGVKRRAMVKKAQSEMSMIVQAINQYHSTYSRYPVSTNAMGVASQNQEDFTFGTTGTGSIYALGNTWTAYQENNSQVMAILMDMTTFPNGTATANFNHVKNPQQIKFLNATMAGNSLDSGIGQDLVYRDPWGNPYIITIDLNYDDKCWDAYYGNVVVSGTANTGLISTTDPNGNTTKYACNGGVMVWSFGPDKLLSFPPTGVMGPATLGNNKDNVLSWKP